MKLLMTTAIIAMTAFGVNAETIDVQQMCIDTKSHAEMLVEYRDRGMSQEDELSAIKQGNPAATVYWEGVIFDIYFFELTKEQAVKAAHDRCIDQFGG